MMPLEKLAPRPVLSALAPCSASETPAGLVMLELASAANRAGKIIAHFQWSLAFTLGKTKAAIDLLEAGDTRNALECLRLAHTNGCHEMDNIPLPSPNVADVARTANHPDTLPHE